MNLLTDEQCQHCRKNVPLAVELCGDSDVICADCLRAALRLIETQTPNCICDHEPPHYVDDPQCPVHGSKPTIVILPSGAPEGAMEQVRKLLEECE